MHSSKTVLIVEDDHDIRYILREALELDGFKVITAINGKDALDILQTTEKPSVIFLDIMMPVMDGHQFLRLVREDAVLAPIPVVVTSATAHPEELKGASAFIKKPVNLDTLLKVARQHCGTG